MYYGHAYRDAHGEVRGQFTEGISSLFPQCGFQELNLVNRLGSMCLYSLSYKPRTANLKGQWEVGMGGTNL